MAMYDPYAVLGVSPKDSDDEIKKAYRKLSRQYHPDANMNNPHPELAEEKFKQIQEAYNQIMRDREQEHRYGSSYSGSYGSSSYGGYSSDYGRQDYGQQYQEEDRTGGWYGGPFNGWFGGGAFRQQSAQKWERYPGETGSHLKAAAVYISGGQYQQALNVLNGMPEQPSLWYYYMAIVQNGLGNNVNALRYAQQAVQMDPNDQDYQMLLQQMQSGGQQWYQTQGRSYGRLAGGLAPVLCALCASVVCCPAGICCF